MTIHHRDAEFAEKHHGEGTEGHFSVNPPSSPGLRGEEAKTKYDELYDEYQDVMHAGAWRIAWGFFFVLVGLLPMMYVFIWAIGPKAWEQTLFHAPKLMWLAPLCTFPLVMFLVFRLYRKNLELDAIKRNYLTELKELKSLLPESPKAIPEMEKEVKEFETDY